MFRKVKLFLVATMLATPFVSTVHPQQSVQAATSSQKQMNSYVRKVMSQYHLRGAILTVKNGQVVSSSLGYGWYGRRIGAGNSKVLYPAASLQKLVTGAMIVQLINEKWHTKQRFTQNTKISRWYPHLKGAKKITVGELLTHTSGILSYGSETNRWSYPSESQAIDWTINQVNSHALGKRGVFYYTNENYVLLAGIIRKLTGKSYLSNFNTRIVNKLRLKHTYIYSSIPRSKFVAISYAYYHKHNYQKAESLAKSVPYQIPGAGNMVTTPSDYYKILLATANGKILNSADFHYLTHLKSRVTTYSGGVYVKRGGSVMTAYGHLSNTHLTNWMQFTSDRKNGIIMFLNQTTDNKEKVKAAGYKILNHIKANTFSAE
ncbi:serine hydrolase domain-containing protein [Lactobacillus corticis]|uniref:Penicillin-binding protein n=1 Tax=Lactobacillus corticis TaxID=2201249 RepID=A0A916VJE1_9LACO|nr:serine hydrolase domain-containing protein [Lactobacillus corticis]GFZ27764.1 penicillin-binding protein [Lactobacillus corticis]